MAIDILLSERDIGRIVRAVIELNAGRANSVVDVTLTPNAASTVVSFVNCSKACAPLPVALTANAAAALATMFISAISNGSFTITHANNAQVDRSFRFVCSGG